MSNSLLGHRLDQGLGGHRFFRFGQDLGGGGQGSEFFGLRGSRCFFFGAAFLLVAVLVFFAVVWAFLVVAMSFTLSLGVDVFRDVAGFIELFVENVEGLAGRLRLLPSLRTVRVRGIRIRLRSTKRR